MVFQEKWRIQQERVFHQISKTDTVHWWTYLSLCDLLTNSSHLLRYAFSYHFSFLAFQCNFCSKYTKNLGWKLFKKNWRCEYSNENSQAVLSRGVIYFSLLHENNLLLFSFWFETLYEIEWLNKLINNRALINPWLFIKSDAREVAW